MQTTQTYQIPFTSPIYSIFGVIAVVLLGVLFSDSFVWVFDQWSNTEEYSHGMMIPFVSAYLIYQRRHKIVHNPHDVNMLGLVMLAVSLALFVIADLATVYVGVLLAFLACLYSLVIVSIGWRNTKELLAPLLILIFMVPLPAFINNNLSSELQLISSQIGVAFIRLFDISVYLEGNVIDLGVYKLQVVDACSGLRYLYPLVALGFILAYLCQIPLWLRVVIFISTVPITVIMNSIRIGAIGVSVEYWGPEMAEGLLHDIEGWFMFMASLSVLLLELVLLLRLSGDKRKLGDVFVIEVPEKIAGQDENSKVGQWPRVHMVMALIMVMAVGGFSLSRTKADELIPDRLNLNHFPLLVGDWYGTPDTMESIYIDALKFDDYMIANYKKEDDLLNFYVAYYESQKKGESAHSPRSCIPGGGWRIESIEDTHLGGLYLNSQPLVVNRTVIRKGDNLQVVYYWFQQRGRIVTNEYLAKWYIFWDALTLNRTDGALVRISIPIDRNDSIERVDQLAADFMENIQFKMNKYVPN